MITLKHHSDCTEVNFTGTTEEVIHDLWAILEAFRQSTGTQFTLEFIEGYLNYLNDEIKERK